MFKFFRRILGSVGSAVGRAVSAVTNMVGLTSPSPSSGVYKPKAPKPPTPRAAVGVDASGNARDTAEMRQARAKKLKAVALAGGRSSTHLTGGLGVAGSASVQRKTLLGE